MKYSTAEINQYIKKVVDETKSTAKVDTGFLKRSIRGNWFKGIATFREVFYGAYNGNSNLVSNAKAIMPKDIPWRVIFVDEEGRETPVEGITKTGRTISRKSISSENISTDKIKKLISLINAKKKVDRAKAVGSVDEKSTE